MEASSPAPRRGHRGSAARRRGGASLLLAGAIGALAVLPGPGVGAFSAASPCFAAPSALAGRIPGRHACPASAPAAAGALRPRSAAGMRIRGVRGLRLSSTPAPTPPPPEAHGREEESGGRHDVASYLAGLKMQKVSFEDNDFYEKFENQTPLWILTQEPDLQTIIQYLQKKKESILQDPDSLHRVRFSRRQLDAARTAFSKMVRRGEMRLHRLCELTGDEIFDNNYARQSVVIGQRPGARGQGQRFQLIQPLSSDELYALTDLDLGSRQLERFKWQQSESWERAALVANFVEYEALEVNKWGVFKCISRIKAEEEIWNKVVDEIFEIDSIVKREKELRHLSRFVKDVFGLKIVVGDEEQARKVQQFLETLTFSPEVLTSHGVPVSDETKRLNFVEVKDYLTETTSQKKTSGWRALKSVVMWWDTPIEIQLQVLRNYHRERERITKESHSEFKAKREQLRDLIASGLPLFGFYRDLLQWLFKTTASDVDSPPPAFKNVYVDLVD